MPQRPQQGPWLLPRVVAETVHKTKAEAENSRSLNIAERAERGRGILLRVGPNQRRRFAG